MRCPKCQAETTQTHKAKNDGGIQIGEDGKAYPASPFEGPLPVFGTDFTELYTCPTYGEFGLKPDGSFEFVEPDTWVEGPNGEMLFRL